MRDYFFISRDLAMVRELCTHVAVLRHGELVEYGLADKVFRSPASDYTRTLIESAPKLQRSPAGAQKNAR